MGFDLSQLLGVLGDASSGAAQGLGNYSSIQFAEQLRQAAEQREFQQRQQLAGENFEREKALRLMIAELSREGDRDALEGQAQQALGAADVLGVPGTGPARNVSRMPNANLNALVGQLLEAVKLTGDARTERAGALAQGLENRALEALAGQRDAAAAASQALAQTRAEPAVKTPTPMSDKDREKQREDRVKLIIKTAQENAELRLDDINPRLASRLTPAAEREALQKEKDDILAAMEALTLEEAFRMADEQLGTSPIRALIEEEAAKAQ